MVIIVNMKVMMMEIMLVMMAMLAMMKVLMFAMRSRSLVVPRLRLKTSLLLSLSMVPPRFRGSGEQKHPHSPLHFDRGILRQQTGRHRSYTGHR